MDTVDAIIRYACTTATIFLFLFSSFAIATRVYILTYNTIRNRINTLCVCIFGELFSLISYFVDEALEGKRICRRTLPLRN